MRRPFARPSGLGEKAWQSRTPATLTNTAIDAALGSKFRFTRATNTFWLYSRPSRAELAGAAGDAVKGHVLGTIVTKL